VKLLEGEKMTEMPIKLENTTRYHVPCVILLDKSGSMEGAPIDALNDALKEFKGKFESDNEDHSVIDICIFAFGGKGNGSVPDIEKLQDFAPANEMFYNKSLIAFGGTPMAQAVETGLKEITRIKKEYQNNAVDYYRPWLVCITDGESTEGTGYINNVKNSLKEATKGKHVIPYGIGVGDECNYKKLYEFFGENHTFRLADVRNVGKFADFFEFLSNSMTAKSESNGEEATMPPAVDKEGNQILEPVKFSAT
jgi:uncharacterized protein YegL